MKMKTPFFLKILSICSILLILAAAIMVFFYAPLEQNMGMVQKVFYFHVAYAWIGMLSFIVAAAAGIFYLVRLSHTADAISESAVEIGLVFTLIAVASGSIWAKPIWNTWWTWDPRLTTTSIMGLIYVGYMLLRRSIDNAGSKEKFSAFYVIIGCLSVPLTFFSIRGFRSIHPVVIGTNSGGMNLTPEMQQTLLMSVLAFTCLYISLLWYRTIYSRLCEILKLTQETAEETYD